VDHLSQLKALLNQNLAKAQQGASAEHLKHDTSVVFKLFSDLEKADLNRSNKIAELNQRLDNLEKVFGPGNAAVNEAQVAKLCTGLENKSILVSISLSA
jgi:hypothetical protein